MLQIESSDYDIICGGVLAFGGQYRNSLTSDTTHLIALTETGDPDTYLKAINRNLETPINDIDCKITIILPEYFDDCFKVRRKIKPDMYTFPDIKIHSHDPFSTHESHEIGIILDYTNAIFNIF